MATRVKKVLIPISIIALFILFMTPGYAQGQSPISATVDRTSLSTDDTLTLTVTINADIANPPQPSLPGLAGFNIIGSSTSSQISIVNGTMSSRLNYNYSLRPYEAGTLVIEPVGVTMNGQAYTTEPINIQVTQGTGVPSAAPAPASRQAPTTSTELAGQKLFVEAEVDNPNPYLGEQVTYTFRFYQAADGFDSFFDQPQFAPPAFKGFWSENQTDQSQYRVQAGGRIYSVTELRTLLFPSVVGPITIEPAQLSTSGGFFNRGSQLQTQPVSLDVRPLPANAPEGFSGAVGQFTINGTLDSDQTRVNEPLTWQVTLSGQGNLNAVPDPVWPEMADWRSFESQASINSQMQDGRIVGSRMYERLLVPEAEGGFTVPALAYTYFDPEVGEFQTVSTLPIPVSVAPGENIVTQQPQPVLPSAARENIEQVATDIRHVKSVPVSLKATSGPITNSGLYWLAWTIPLFGLVGNFVWQRRQQFWQNNADLARSSQAHKKAKKALAQAHRQKQDVYSQAGQILTTYLSDKLNQPVLGLTRLSLADLLEEKGLAPELVERIDVCLADAELGHYSPDANNPDHAKNLLREIDILIKDLEKAF